MKKQIIIDGMDIGYKKIDHEDYISLTDMAKYKNAEIPAHVISHWLSTKFAIDFLGIWEMTNNPNFKLMEFREFKNESGGSFTLSPKQWIEKTNAIGIVSNSGRYGGTYAHKDIAFEFATWIDISFKLYLIKEFERLKTKEAYQNKIEWSVKRELSKTNYAIHTDSIKEYIIPMLTDRQKQFVYADEADVLNVALFGMTAKEWRDRKPELDGNIRDYADVLKLVILTNLENLNAEMIVEGISQRNRIEKLNNAAKRQLEILKDNAGIKRLENMDKINKKND